KDMLGLTRDMLVFKVSGGDEKLTESARLRPEELAELAAHFSPSDLTRFFNSLATTETQLRAATHSRHTLEIGLVKLAEMRRLADLEDLIEKLGSASNGNAAVTEKKTLIEPKPAIVEPVSPPIPAPEPKIEAIKLETKPVEPVAEVQIEESEINEPEEPPYFDDQPSDFDEPTGNLEPPFEYTPPPISSGVPLQLASLSSEDLEHVDDEKLDQRYEDQLAATGDSLLPIAQAASFVALFSGESISRRMAAYAANAAVSTAPKRDMSHLIPDLKSGDAAVEVPILSDAPTADELVAFANAHPTVRAAKRIFRAEVVSAFKPNSGT
ncbi:MAG TPA: hypothetical protein PKA82_17135, partial [Pyrinomonadaceae bacterium]|nr:hypothetical protein [Pyrinomonadaceae bacterium]